MSTAVGFSPVTPGNGVITTGVTAAAAAEGASPLGFVDALLGLLAQGVTLAVPAGGEGEADPEANAGTEADLGALANLGLAVDAAIKGGLPPTLPEDGKPLLDDLVAALAAIEDAAASGQPIDPALHKKLSDTLDEIAGMLGIVLPQAPVTTLESTIATAAPAADVTLDAGLTIENKPLPLDYELPTADETVKPDSQLADDFLEAVKQATVPAPVTEEPATDDVATTTPTTEDGETTDPETPVGRMIVKLLEVAEKLETKLPDVSAKLEALAQKLAAKTLDPETLAQLNADIEAGDFDAILAPKPEAATKPVAPAPALFTAPALPTPAAAVLPPVQTQAPKPVADAPKAAEPAVPDEEPALAEPVERQVAKDTKPAERPDTEPKVRERGSFAQHLNEARAEKPADPAQSQQAPVAPVKTDLGVITPKSVHAAYQAPVQQINVPQVAFEVVRQFNQGNSRFQIRLDPPELGRIDVRMQVDGDGNVHARMTVERAETLDLMQRDQRSLEKALAQAGLDSNKTNLEFSLRQNPFGRDGQNQQQHSNGSPFASRGNLAGSDEAAEIASTTTQYRGLASPSGVNLFV